MGTNSRRHIAGQPSAPKVQRRSAQGKLAEQAPPWVKGTMIDGTLKACGRTSAPHRRPKVMGQSLAKVLIHLVFSTKHRAALLPPTPYPALHAYTQGIFKKQKCHLIEMNNVADH